MKTNITWRIRRDFLPQLLLISAALCAVQANAQAEDFTRTCAQAGVVKCVGFDSRAEIEGKVSQGNGAMPQLDTTEKASGAGSLKMTYAPGGAQSTGAWKDGIGGVFGQRTKLYFAYKQRFSSGVLSGAGGGNGWKQHILYGDKSCGPMEITTQNTYHRGFPQMYSQCGSYQFREALSGGDYRYQMGEGLDCRYNNMSGCADYVANKWITFYYEVEIGTWGSANSKLRAYMQIDGKWQQWMNMPTLTLESDGAAGFQNIQLTMYTTEGTGGSTANAWYDDFIVSSQPIYDVNAQSAPALQPRPPGGLSVN